MSENKILRFRFDNLKGDTPLQRLSGWLRRRNIRNLALCTAFILCFCAELLVFKYLGAENEDVLLLALVGLCLLGPVYIPLWFWLGILVFRPDLCSGIRRLKRLGSLEKFVMELEEDLAAEGVVLLKKHVSITRRFIIEASMFYFRVYPLEGLHEFDGRRRNPIFYYENGTNCKVATSVPFRMLRTYIKQEGETYIGAGKPESPVYMKTAKPKPKKGDVLAGIAVFLCISGALLYLLFFRLSAEGVRAAGIWCYGVLLGLLAISTISEVIKPESKVYMETEPSKRDTILGLMLFLFMAGALLWLLCLDVLPQWGVRVAVILCWGVLLWIISLVVTVSVKNRRLARMLSDIKDTGARICKMEELYTEGWYNNPVVYLNQLSALYYDKEDPNKALELIREALRIQPRKGEFQKGSEATLSEILKLNEIVYLTALERFDEAEPLLVPFYDKRYRNPVNLYIINATRAEFAIRKGDTNAAREYLHNVNGLFGKDSVGERQVNIFCHLLLLEAECDLLERDTASALSKIDDILARSTWPPNVKRAAELKKGILRRENSMRRRKHGFHSHQSRRSSGRKYASAKVQSRRRTNNCVSAQSRYFSESKE